jgi:hypothetical protein
MAATNPLRSRPAAQWMTTPPLAAATARKTAAQRLAGVTQIHQGADAVVVRLLPPGFGEPFAPPHAVDAAGDVPGIDGSVPPNGTPLFVHAQS